MQAEAEQQYVEYLTARLHRLHRVAYLLCGDRHRAEDVVQSTALLMYRHWRWVRSADNIDGYVNQILIREFLSLRRLSWSRVVLTDRPPDRAVPPDTSVEDRDAVTAALARLGKRQRAVIVLRFFCDLSVEQTAEVLACSEGTVKSQTSRGLQLLRQLLGATYRPAATPTTVRNGDSHA